MSTHRRLSDTYRFPGFTPEQEVVGVFGDPKARVIRLKRNQKKLTARRVARLQQAFMIERTDVSAIFHAASTESTLIWRYAGLSAGDARK